MRTTHRRRLTATVVAVGAGALTLGTALPGAAVDAPSGGLAPLPESLDEHTFSATFVEPHSSGREALTQLNNDDLAFIAQRAGMSASKLESYLERDMARVTPGGFITLVDDWKGESGHDHGATAGDVPGDPVEGSRPGAPYTIFIDFDGHTIEKTEWNRAYELDEIDVPAYNVDDDFKFAVWEGVAQKYAPFNVNVTISDPGADALFKTSANDDTYGSHLLILPDDSPLPGPLQGMGGWAMLGGFGNEYLAPALVIAGNLNDNPKAIADAGAHEVGHNLSLEHHGINGQEYYAPNQGLWGPIMGAPYSVPLGTWSDGNYGGASNPDQDDIASILDAESKLDTWMTFRENGDFWTTAFCWFKNDHDADEPQPGDEAYEPNDQGSCDPLGPELTLEFYYGGPIDHVSDPHGDDPAGATALEAITGEFAEDGVILTADDVDVFAFVTAGGPFTAEAAPVGRMSPLDVKLSLLDADGTVIAENEQETTVGSEAEALGVEASLSEDLELGVYYLQVEGRGQGDPSSNTPAAGNGYSDYGSLGYYTLTGTVEPFDAALITITSPEDGAEVEPSGLEVTGTAEPTASVTLTIDGETVGSTDVDGEGNWSATLEEDLPAGESTITARQTVGTIDVPGSASVTVVVPSQGDDDGAEDGSDEGTEDGTEDGAEDGTEDGGTDDGSDEDGAEDGGTDSGTDDGDDEDLPDTGTSSLIVLLAGVALLAVGGVLYGRTRRATV